MTIANEVRPGANRYVSGQGVLKELPTYLKQFEKIAIVTGEISFKVFNDYYQKKLDYPVFHYDGSASREDAKHIADQIQTADLILAIGGGRVCDTAKMVAENLAADVLIVPTLASNCAPFTPVAAVYHPDRTFREIGYFVRAPYLTLVDWDFLLITPKDYLVAGIGDTLAKWYEIEGITRNLDDDHKTAYIRLGIAAAKEISAILLTDSKQALTDLTQKNVSPAFGRIVDTVIALSGESGGFAATYGRSAGAHAIHDGLSYLTETHDQLHGKKVAYGILVQLAHTGDVAEIKKLQPFYEAVGLPLKLHELNVTDNSQTYLAPVIKHAASKNETFRMVDPAITEENVWQAVHTVEEL